MYVCMYVFTYVGVFHVFCTLFLFLLREGKVGLKTTLTSARGVSARMNLPVQETSSDQGHDVIKHTMHQCDPSSGFRST